MKEVKMGELFTHNGEEELGIKITVITLGKPNYR
jgi:hypothetical protein